MLSELCIEIPGVPVAKGRPKLSTRGGFARAYTPAKTRRFEDLVRLSASIAMDGREPFDGPLAVCVAVAVAIPKTLQTKPKLALIEQGSLKPTTRPDLDNYIKVIDGLNGIVWNDDAQIVELAAFKQYSSRPRLAITVRAA